MHHIYLPLDFSLFLIRVWLQSSFSGLVVVCIADGSAIPELRRGLEEYLSLLIGLTNKGPCFHFELVFLLFLPSHIHTPLKCEYVSAVSEYGLEGLVEFKWRSLDDGKHV